MAKYYIDLTPSKAHEPYISKDITDEKDLKWSAYNNALIALNGIINSAIEWDNKKNKVSNAFFLNTDLYSYANNILAFCADRGQGKTSAMLSFSNALSNVKKLKESLEGKEGKRTENFANIVDSEFCVIPPIDPTMLSNTNVIEIIISRLFKTIEERWNQISISDQRMYNKNEMKKVEILEYFQKCIHGIEIIDKRKNIYENHKFDEFELLAYAEDGNALKESLFSLIKGCLDIILSNEHKKFLVIQLDDTDLQFENAYFILEDVRKYLSLPNVIVLMATDLDQLSRLVKKHYKEVVPDDEDNIRHRMAAKYLDKLIPVSQTIFLPTVKIQYESNETIGVTIDGDVKHEDFQIYLFQEIYRKTGIVLLKHTQYMHYIIPTTLRGVRQLYSLLASMGDCESKYDEAIKRIVGKDDVGSNDIPRDVVWNEKIIESLFVKCENLSLFEDYFLHDWCSSKLLYKDCKIIEEIHRAVPADSIKQACGLLINKYIELYGKYIEEDDGNKKDVNDYRDDSNPYLCLQRLLGGFEKKAMTTNDYLFIFAVRMYFSIQFQKIVRQDMRTCYENWYKGECSERPFVFISNRLYERLYGGLFEKVEYMKTNGENLRLSVNGEYEWLSIYTDLLKDDLSSLGRDEQIRILIIKEYAITVCCNWDVQERIRKLFNKVPGIKEKIEQNVEDGSINDFGHVGGCAIDMVLMEKYYGDGQDEIISNLDRFMNFFRIREEIKDSKGLSYDDWKKNHILDLHFVWWVTKAEQENNANGPEQNEADASENE